MPPNTFQPVSYTIEKITFDERGKKKLCWQPPKWQQITKQTMKKYNKPSHKGKCIITGKKSGFTAIDCDTEHAYADIIHDYPELKEAYTVKTPRGFHIYVAYEPLVKTCTTNLDIDENINDHIDLIKKKKFEQKRESSLERKKPK